MQKKHNTWIQEKTWGRPSLMTFLTYGLFINVFAFSRQKSDHSSYLKRWPDFSDGNHVYSFSYPHSSVSCLVFSKLRINPLAAG